jgi:hypothetical protein
MKSSSVITSQPEPSLFIPFSVDVSTLKFLTIGAGGVIHLFERQPLYFSMLLSFLLQI